MRFDLIAVGDVLLDASLPELIPGQRVHGRIQLRPGGSATNGAGRAATPEETLRARFGPAGTDDDAVPGVRRFYAADPWGNRLEFVDASG